MSIQHLDEKFEELVQSYPPEEANELRVRLAGLTDGDKRAMAEMLGLRHLTHKTDK